MISLSGGNYYNYVCTLPPIPSTVNIIYFVELQLLSLVLILIAALMTLLAHIFFVCGYIPCAKCKTCGLGGLPAVLITSGKAF